jgi:hypothetical protein
MFFIFYFSSFASILSQFCPHFPFFPRIFFFKFPFFLSFSSLSRLFSSLYFLFLFSSATFSFPFHTRPSFPICLSCPTRLSCAFRVCKGYM